MTLIIGGLPVKRPPPPLTAFQSRLLALPGVLEVREDGSRWDSEVAAIGSDPELEYIDVDDIGEINPDYEKRLVVLEKAIIYAGLEHEPEAAHLNPLEEGGANGNLYSRNTRFVTDNAKEFYSAVGCDEHGNRLYETDAVRAQLGVLTAKWLRDSDQAKLLTELRGHCDRAGRFSVQKAVAQAIGDGSDTEREFARFLFGREDDYLAELVSPVVSFITSESNLDAAWEAAQDAGKIGNPYAINVDVYEHGLVSFQAGGVPDASSQAVWVPDEDALDNIKANAEHEAGCKPSPEAIFKAAEAYAKLIMDEYTDWSNGSVYRVVACVVDRVTGEILDEHTDMSISCIGSDSAESEMESLVLSIAQDLTTSPQVQ